MWASEVVRRLRGVAAILLVPALAAAELPEKTLAVFVARSADAIDSSVAELLRPWRLRFNGVGPVLKRTLGGADLADRPFALGLAERNGAATPFALLPVDDAAAFRKAVKGGPDGVAAIAGYLLAVEPVEGGVLLAMPDRDRAPVVGDASLAGLDALLGETSAAIRVTRAGFALAADQTARLRPVRRRVVLSQIRSIREAWLLLGLAPRYQPLLRAFADRTDGVTVRVSADDEALTATLDIALRGDREDDPRTPVPPAPPLVANLGDRVPIATLRSAGPLPGPLVRLVLALAECRPDEIDAAVFDGPTFAAYAESVAELAASVVAAEAALLVPTADEPLAANRAVALRTEPGADHPEAVKQAAEAWNAVVSASRARTPLVYETAEIDAAEGGGLRLSMDTLRAFGGQGVEEVVRVVERYYGPGGRLVTEDRPTGEDRWLATELPKPAADRLRAALPEVPDTPDTKPEVNGQLWIDRWLAWRQALDDVGKEKDVGRKVRPPMVPSPPAELRLTGGKRRLLCELNLPPETYEAIAAYWTEEKTDQR